MADRTLLVIQNDVDDPPARLGLWLEAAGVQLDVRRMWDGATLPGELAEHDGLLVLGAVAGAHEDDVAPWLPAVRALLGEAVRSEVPVLGICLGAQLLAAATGGRVERGADGPELGAQLIAKRSAAATDPLFGPMPITPDVIQWHYDAIVALPPGAVLLSSSPTYEVQAFRIGRLAWGVQGHIETTPEIARGWAETDPTLIDYDLTRLIRRMDDAHDFIEQAWQPVAQRFADVVADPGSVRPAGGPSVVTAVPVDDPAAIRAALAQQMQSARAPMQFGRPPGDGGGR